MSVPVVTLVGRVVRLEPLAPAHAIDLTEAGQDDDIWRFMPYGVCRTVEKMRGFIRYALDRQAQGTTLPFAVIHLATGRAVGSTRYLDIQPENRALEIGGTWYAPTHQRTAVNTECKYLLLRHAFEALGYQRVQLKTDLRNERSQKAIERVGAAREGVLRCNMILPDGYRRSSVMYSILVEEWPAVKTRLEGMLGGR